MAALAAVTNSNNGIATSTGESQSGASASGVAISVLASTIANLSQVEELQAVERTLNSPNRAAYRLLSSSTDLDSQGSPMMESIRSFSEDTSLLTMYERVGSELNNLNEITQCLSNRLTVEMKPITIEGRVYSDPMHIYEQFSRYGSRRNYVREKFAELRSLTEWLFTTRNGLRTSLGTVAVISAVLPAAASSLQKTSA